MRSNSMIGVMALLSCSGLAFAQTSTDNGTEPTTQQTTTTTIGVPATLTAPATPVQKDPAKNNTTTLSLDRSNTGATKTATKTGTKTNAGDPFPAYTTANLPAKQHFELTAAFIGEWTTTTTTFGGQNGATTTAGRARFFPTMNGRFVCGDLEGNLWGKSFQGLGLWGFNTNENRYESTWVDTANTGITTFTGTKTDDKTYTWTGNVTNPSTGKTEQGKGVTTFTDKNTFTYAFYVTNEGTETKAYETTYTRVSAGGPFAIRPVDSHIAGTNAKNQTRTTSVTDQQSQTDK
jgi:Protein of unknown function (DUF1579)